MVTTVTISPTSVVPKLHCRLESPGGTFQIPDTQATPIPIKSGCLELGARLQRLLRFRVDKVCHNDAKPRSYFQPCSSQGTFPPCFSKVGVS